MPEPDKIKLSGQRVFTVVLPRDRVAIVRAAQDESDPAQRNGTATLTALAVALGAGAKSITLEQAKASGFLPAPILYAVSSYPPDMGVSPDPDNPPPTWNNVAQQRVVLVQGLPGGSWASEGVLVVSGGSQRVDVNVAAGTYVASAGGGTTYTAGPGITLTGSTISAVPTVGSAPVVGATPTLHFDQPTRLYAPLSSGTFATDLTSALPGGLTRIVLGPSCTVPTLGSAFHPSGAFVAGAPNEYLFLVEPDGATVQVVITPLP